MLGFVVACLVGLGLFLFGVLLAAEFVDTWTDDSILINCIQIGEETLNGETSTFYTCEGIR